MSPEELFQEFTKDKSKFGIKGPFTYGFRFDFGKDGKPIVEPFGNIKKEKDGEFLRTETGMPASPIFAGYPEWWYKAIVNATGDHFKVLGPSH